MKRSLLFLALIGLFALTACTDGIVAPSLDPEESAPAFLDAPEYVDSFTAVGAIRMERLNETISTKENRLYFEEKTRGPVTIRTASGAVYTGEMVSTSRGYVDYETETGTGEGDFVITTDQIQWTGSMDVEYSGMGANFVCGFSGSGKGTHATSQIEGVLDVINRDEAGLMYFTGTIVSPTPPRATP